MISELKWMPAVLAACLLLAGCGDTGDAKALDSAKSHLAKKELDAATVELKSLLQKNPSSPQGRFLLGKALLEAGDAAGAEAEFRRAQELQYPEAEIAPLLAQAMLALRQYGRLTLLYAEARLDDPEATVSVQLAVAAAFAAEGAIGDAQAAVDRALAIAPQSTAALVAKARVVAQSGDVDGALSRLEAVLAHNPKVAEAWQLKGDLLSRFKGNFAAAIEAYQQALAVQPDMGPAHADLITLYHVQQDEKSAEQQFAALKVALPGHPLTRMADAQNSFKRGDYRRARELLQPLLQALPDNVGVLFLSGATELQLDSLAQAEIHLLKALRLQPRYLAARTLLARVYLRGKLPDKAVAVLRPVLDGKEKADAETLTLAGQAHLLAGDRAAAEVLFVRAAALKPTDVRSRTALALAQLSRGQADAAIKELQAIAAADKGVEADRALINAQLERKEFEAALKAIDRLETKQPDKPLPAELRGRVHLARKDLAAARAAFGQAVSRDPTYLPAVSSLAAMDYLDGKPDAARSRYEALLKSDPKNVQALLALAELTRMTGGSHDEVAKRLADAVAVDPADVSARRLLIEHHRATGDAKAAVAAAQAATAALPGNVDLQDKLARSLLANGEAEQAAATFGKMAAEHADSSLGYQGLAETSLAKKDFAAAARNAKRALDLTPNSLEAQRVAIYAAMGLKRPQDAAVIARSVQAQRPKDALGFILEGEIEVNQQQWEPAIVAFRKATARANPVQAASRLHFALVRAGKASEAAQFAEAWQRDHPKDVIFQIYLADAASAQGNWALAERHYRQAIKLQPENPMALNNLAWLLVRQRQPGAVELAERAVKVAPGQLGFMDTLALALSSEGQHAKAIELQKKVVAQKPDVPAYHLTLAKVYLLSGDKAGARAELEGLVKLGPDFKDQAEVAELLKGAV